MLSHSRKGYGEVVHKQTTESLIQCLENAFHAFGGVPQTVVFDNAPLDFALVTRCVCVYGLVGSSTVP